MTRRAALMLVCLLALLPLAAPWLSPFDPERQLDIVALRSVPPSTTHWFGTDSYSRDVLSRVLHGSRVSMSIAFAAVAILLMLGTVYGAATALAPRPVSVMLRRALDLCLSIPRILVLLALSAFVGPLALWQLVLLVGVTGWFAVARQVAESLDALLTEDFSLAARALGVRTPRLVLRHLLPHLLPVLAVSATFAVASTIALETTLSFLGLGVQPPTASWGSIMRDGTTAMTSEWWMTLFPGLATIGVTMACNALGDALRGPRPSPQLAS